MLASSAPIRSKLLTSQQDYINQSIEHFFYELPTEEKALTEQLQGIRKAFNKELDEKSPFYDIQNCIYDPLIYLRSVDIFANKITLGDLREYLLTYITNTLLAAFNDAQVEFPLALWDKDQIALQLEKEKDFATPFVSVKSKGQGITTHAWVIQHPEGIIYNVEYLRVGSSIDLVVNVMVNREEKTEKEVRCIERFRPIPALYSDEDEEKFISGLATPALQAAEEAAAKIVIQDFEFDEENLTTGAKSVLTYQYYYDLLYNEQLDIDDIAEISLDQAQTLIHPCIIDMLENEIVNIATALRLTKKQRIALTQPFFFKKLVNEEYTLEDFTSLTDAQCNLLILPNIQHLFTKNILKHIAEINYVSGSLTKVINDEIYFNLILANPPLFFLLRNITLAEAEQLLFPSIKSLIVRDILKINMALELSLRQGSILKNELIAKLVMDNKITLSNALILPHFIVVLINANPFIYETISSGKLLADGINTDPFTFLGDIFSSRIINIYHNTAVEKKETKDETVQIKKYIEQLALGINYSPEKMINLVYKRLTNRIRSDLEHELKLEGSDVPPFYNDILDVIHETDSAGAPPDCWAIIFSSINAIAKEILALPTKDIAATSPAKKSTLTSTLFLEKPRLESLAGIKEFCEKIVELGQLNYYDVDTKLTAEEEVEPEEDVEPDEEEEEITANRLSSF